MIVEPQHVITITYELRNGSAEGELLERMDVHYPFIFLYGTGKLLPAFERHLAGLSPHDTFDFILTPEEGYGPIRSENIVDVPIHLFHDEQDRLAEEILIRGNFVALTDDQGETHNGKIVRWDDEQVRVDFNHAMAGKTLHFKGTVLHIRPATVDELVRQHYIQDDGLRG